VAVSTVDGEPRKATGEVCAVLPGYETLTHELAVSGTAGFCNDTECAGRLALVTADGERSYAQSYRCPAGTPFYDPDRCTESRAGDETLLFETYAEGVVGAARDPLVVYLAQPAPAGSFTAWELGSADALGAGYHVFVRPTPDEMNERFACQGEVFNPTAFDEIRATYGERVREEFGEGAELLHPGVLVPRGGTFVYEDLPEDITAGANRILADYEMANCPMPQLTRLDPLTQDVSLTIDVYEGAPRGWPGAPTAPSSPPAPPSP
jgi:hypothetical protein